jgi:hypothetical protein
MKLFVLLIIILFIIILCIMYKNRKIEKYNSDCSRCCNNASSYRRRRKDKNDEDEDKESFNDFSSKEINYTGVVIFDIDGTLTAYSKENNSDVVQYYLDNNYAVGISTAGGIYNPGNLLQFSWMPENLYKFMEENDFDTFNNVRTYVVTGFHKPKEFTEVLRKSPSENIFFNFGWLKGFTLEETAKKYNISDYSKVIMFDDQTYFLEGMYHYNNEFKLFCVGGKKEQCNNIMNVQLAEQTLNM